MKVLRPGVDVDAFFEAVAGARSRVLMLDYDGTLAPFREARDEAVPYPGVREAVRAEAAAPDSRVVVVSGRSIEVLRALLGIEPPPELWGSHGWERLEPDGTVTVEDPGPAARARLEQARAIAGERVPDSRVEVKPVSVAVHHRGLDGVAAGAQTDELRAAWSGLAEGSVVELHDFDGGLEVRVPDRDKGTAVDAILADEPDDAAVAYLGDDRTDEDAFRALGRRQLTGAGEAGACLRVLVRDALRDTAADLWIRPPDELLDFLRRWRRAASGGSHQTFET